MSTLSLIVQALGYKDVSRTSNPTRVPINWRRPMPGLQVDNPSTQLFELDPQSTTTVIDGTRSLALDNTTAFSLASNSLVDANRYRITWTGGTDPGFRTDRALDLSTVALTLTVNANQSVTVTGGTGHFSGVSIGDVVFIPGVSSGDAASPFSPLNEGYWTALAADANSLTLARMPGETFEGASETVTPSTASQLQAFSAAGVQVGDTVDISAGFAAPAQRTFDLVAVNPKWIEFESTAPLGPQTGITPTTTGLAIYTMAKRFLFIESDQEIVVRLNGDTGNTTRVTPIIPGDENFPGVYAKIGPAWKLVLVNRSSSRANVTVAHAE